MSHDLGDLLPLFCSEAGDRIERLVGLAQEVERDAEAARQAKRELHALKGATRMMRLTDLSELCHEAEGLLDPAEAGCAARLTALLDRLAGEISRLEGGDGPGSSPEAAAEAAVAEEPPFAEDQDLRIRTDVLDRLADRGARLRILAIGAAGTAERLDQLANLAERGVNEALPQQVLAALATSMRQVALEMEADQRALYRLADRQLDEILGLQIQPLRPLLLHLARHARELARSLGKDVDVLVEAGDSHLDRRLVNALREALLHLVRNAVDHGVEPAEVREGAGKTPRGTVRLEARTDGGRVRLVVADDGRGIDPEHVLAAARERGLLTAEAAARMEPGEVVRLLLSPGFSTRAEASAISGRGVGLDAVAAAVHGVGGDLHLDGAPGNGTQITLELPVTRRGERVLVLRVGRTQVAIPAAVVRGFRRLDGDLLVAEDRRTLVQVDGSLMAAVVLDDLLGVAESTPGVLVHGLVGGGGIAAVADGVVGEEEVLLRPLPAGCGAPALFDAMAVLAEGRAVPVLAPRQLLGVESSSTTPETSPHPDAQALKLLLVDDCLVTREMVRRLLEDGGFVVQAVSSAGEALRRLSEDTFDCLVTDIEMPEMDGLELTRRLRGIPRLAQLPIVVVSTRDDPRDRLAGLDAGADAYLSKQNLDARELIAAIRRVGGGA